MGSDKKKHKKESKKRKHRSRSASVGSNSSNELRQDREKHDRKKHKKHKVKKSRRRSKSKSIEEVVHSDSSDCIEVPLAPPAPTIKGSGRDADWEPSPSPEPVKEFREVRSKHKSRSRSPPVKRKLRTPSPPSITHKRRKSRSFSPIPDGGAGDCLSIEETNRLRAKLGLKPLEVGPEKAKTPEKTKSDSKSSKTDATPELKVFKDDWGEFTHKPAENFAEKSKVQKIREKLKERKEKRALEAKISAVKGLGESDEEDNAKNWVERQRKQQHSKAEAAKREKMLEEMDEEFGVGELVEQETRKARKRAYTGRDLKGLKVDHDFTNFMEGKQVILTLKDKGVLDEEEDDTLVNVNMLDDERYKKSNENKKQNPNRYGYDVYEEQVDEFGQPIERNMLSKYDDETGSSKKSTFVIGEDIEEERRRKRKILELKAKLNHKRLESLDTIPLTLASEYYNDEEMTKFKKPKKKVKKIRQKLKADDLLAISGNHDYRKDLGSRQRQRDVDTDDVPEIKEDLSKLKVEVDDDLEQVLAKARRLKQKQSFIQRTFPIVPMDTVKQEIKQEDEESSDTDLKLGSNIILNQTAEFCRTLGDIPTYGQAGNRDTDTNDMMDFENVDMDIDENARKQNTWNTVDPDVEIVEPDDVIDLVGDAGETAILDEEPDVAAGVAAALKLAVSKGYLEKEDNCRPSNARFAHLQAQHYSIEDKAHGEDDKYGRRDRYSGPLSDFKDKEGYKPNVKLEYIDDNGHLLNAKEAFRYLSHKFHGKGPGKNKVEKRLKKAEQETLMMKMSSTDTPLGTLNMLQEKQKETQSPFVVLSGNRAGSSSFSKPK